MNRIKHLIEQVGTDSSGNWMRIDQAELLAELIIQECIRLCDQVDIVGADECIDNIKEHFGVEE